MQLASAERIEKPHGVVINWYNDRQIYMLHMSEPGRASIDTVVEILVEINTNWDISKPYLGAVQYSTRALITPYFRDRAPAAADSMKPDAFGRYCIIVPRGPLGQTITFFLNREFSKMMPPHMIANTFTDSSKALAWLSEELSDTV